MAKKKLLTVDFEYDFSLLGILCHYKDYRLCDALNKTLHIELERKTDLEVVSGKNIEQSAFALYSFVDENERQYHILANKGTNNKFLIPEQNRVDYFMMLKGLFTADDIELIRANIKQIAIVLGAYTLQIEDVKSRDNFLF